jgi:hypothetical protein
MTCYKKANIPGSANCLECTRGFDNQLSQVRMPTRLLRRTVMDFLHEDFQLTTDQTVVVTLDQQANVMLLDDIEFQNYRAGRGFKYFGGLVTQSPARLSPPHTGHWHLVMDLGGASGTLRHSVTVVG